jgi:pimeloyl-ACP methyl ester carboxylesterase
VPRAGHTVQGDNPAALVRELRRFLDEVLPEGEKTVSRG